MVDQHKHCPTCGTPIPMNERFCSPKCEQVIAERQRKIMRTRKIMYIAFAALIIIYLLYVFRGAIF
jgi:predicted nucleic acid-binding Zn ribbon protein